MNFKNKRRLGIGVISMVITYCWISVQFPLNFISFWLLGLGLSLANVIVLRRIIKLWKIPVVVIGMDLIYHLYSAIRLYYDLNSQTEPIYHTPFIQALQYSVGCDNALAIIWVEVPFVILTILITIGFIIYDKIKIEMNVID